MNILIEIDSFSPEELTLWLSEISDSHELFLLHKENTLIKFKGLFEHYPNVTELVYKDIFDFSPEISVYIDYDNFRDIYFKNGMPFYLTDRDGIFPSYGQGIQSAMIYYLWKVPSIIGFLKEKGISTVYFRNTPHHSIEWLLATCSQFIGLEVIVSQRHILPWRYSLALGFGRHREIIDFGVNVNDEDHLDKFIEMNSNEYQKALPSYEKTRLKKNKNKLINPLRQYKELFFKPPYYFLKIKAYKRYNLLSETVDYSKAYIVFFLHVQPERTTLPEGYGFQNQLLALMELRQSTPADISIYVKEHPSMFTLEWNPKARNVELYNAIITLNNVHLVHLDTDSFKLVDHSIAVATITGTVGLQAYIRKKPVIYFGLSFFNASGVHVYSTQKELDNFLNKLIRGGIQVTDVKGGLISSLKGSVSGLPEHDSNIDYHSFLPYHEKAHFRLLTLYLNTKREI